MAHGRLAARVDDMGGHDGGGDEQPRLEQKDQSKGGVGIGDLPHHINRRRPEKAPGPGGSLGKLHGAKIARAMRSITSDVHGADIMAYEADDKASLLARSILTSFSANIAGGTDEIQKNIIGDRVLGLPREPAVDTKVPFKELKVGTQR